MGSASFYPVRRRTGLAAVFSQPRIARKIVAFKKSAIHRPPIIGRRWRTPDVTAMNEVAVPMKILFLHGWHSVPGGVKPSYLAQQGHEVMNPALDDDDFEEAVCTAQAEYDSHRPDVIVGSSRGGAVAMNIDSGSTPLVLLCPAWKRWGTAKSVEPGTVILHAEDDEEIPIAESRELVQASGLPDSALVVVGNDHRLADPEPLQAMLAACERAILRGKTGDD